MMAASDRGHFAFGTDALVYSRLLGAETLMTSGIGPKAGDHVRELIKHFPKYVSEFDREPPFRLDQQRSHLATVDRKKVLGTASNALADDEFLRLLYGTLRLW